MSRDLLRRNPRPNLAASADKHLAKDALFGLSRNAPHLVEADVASIEPNPNQPRRHFDEAELRGLADSIERDGLQQPVGLKRIGDGRYQLVYGERRLRAVRLLGLPTIFGVLVTGDSEEIALVENLQRADLTPFEQADAFAGLIERHGYSHAQVAKIVGRDKSEITRTLSLRALPDRIRADYGTCQPTMALLRAIAKLDGEAEQLKRWDEYKRLASGEPSPPPSPAPAPAEASADVQDTPHPARRPAASPNPVSGSHLPKRVAMHVFMARNSLSTLRDKPLDRPLSTVDRTMLREMRDAIDALLAEEESVA